MAGIVAAATLALIGFASFPAKEQGSKYITGKVTRGDIVSTVNATGMLNPVRMVFVGTQLSGTIKSVHADFNSRVKKGEILATLDPASFEAQVEQAKGALLSAEANMQRAIAVLNDARRSLARKRELFSGGHIPLSVSDTAETNYDIAEARVNGSSGEVAHAKGALASAETDLRHTIITSPVTGIVISKNTEVGQTVAASFQTPTLFSIAQDLTKMRIECSVDEADIAKVAVNQPVEFSVEAYPDMTFRAKVSEIRQAPIIAQNVVSYDVVVEVNNPELLLRPGMTANVCITAARVTNVIRIPNAALRFMSSRTVKSEKMGKGKQVWIPDKEKLKRIDVATGICDADYTEMVSGELKEGMELVVESRAKAGTKKPSGAGSVHGVRY
jgi:HlyD family secretion protein